MKLIIEGADATGKSTLAREMASRLRLPYIRSRGPAKGAELDTRLNEYMAATSGVFDRFALISEPIYRVALRHEAMTHDEQRTIMRFYQSMPIVIYASHGNLRDHVATNACDTPDYLMRLARNDRQIRMRYVRWAKATRHIRFDRRRHTVDDMISLVMAASERVAA